MPAMPTALIAEDEPLLAAALQAELATAWPELRVLATVGDGASAVELALALLPDVLFFDVRMPALSGLEAAAALADDWPPSRPFPALVFVTAYDEYALKAFDTQAVDYVLKPVQPARLRKTVERLRELLAARSTHAGGAASDIETTLSQLRRRIESAQAPGAGEGPLQVIQAGTGTGIRMVPIDDVVCFEAADKYVRVLTSAHEHLIRTPLRELLPRLDPAVFWQVHRGTVVRATAIDTVVRDESGKLSLTLRGRPGKLPVSRLYAHRFKAM
jgi:DNA-binding LytR/AlgR family response regulator